MGLKIENVLSGLVVFSILLGLTFSVYSGFEDEYEITPDYVDGSGRNVIEALMDINVISGLEEVQTAIKALYSSDTETGSDYDILGTLRAAAIGTVKLATGVLSAPLEIIGIITGFYTIPTEIAVGIGLIIIIYLGWMVLSELLGK